MQAIMTNVPVITLRGLTILPEQMVRFDVTRRKSIAALEKAMLSTQEVFLIAQKDAAEEPTENDLYRIGTLVEVKQLIKLPGGTIRVIAENGIKARLLEFDQTESYYIASIEKVEIIDEDLEKEPREAMRRIIKELIGRYAFENSKIDKEVIKGLRDNMDLHTLLQQTISFIPFNQRQKQEFLECEDIISEYEILAKYLSEEIDILQIKKEYTEKVKEKVEKNQKEYILREQMKIIREELGEDDSVSDAENFLKELKKLKADKQIKEKIGKEIKRFKILSSGSSESNVVRGYIETLLEMPWDKCSKDNVNIKNAEDILNRDHYGLEKAKERILEFLAVRTMIGSKGKSPIICLVGPPGTGKTSIAKSVAEALNKEYIRICLGGVRDEAEIRGHRKTYIGAMPGRIATGLKQAGVKNPLMLLDEIDKLGNDYKGDPSSALLEVLDAEQNSKFRDNYIELPIDLSQVLFIATANDINTIPRPLLDRMEVIEVSSYTLNEKEHIATEHLIDKQRKANGLSKSQLSINKKAITMLINGYTKEAGVRNLERTIGKLCRKAAKEILDTDKKNVKVNISNIENYLGKPKYTTDMVNKKDEVGIVRGLAWTSVGGDTLQVEVNTMSGKGELVLTGKLGDVMKESARAGITYIRSIADKYNIEADYFEEHDIHIHIPEGAVPKDGPSAGITMATAMLSAVTGIKVKASIAMTGEITLRGRVLPIGGLKEKILAAKMAGVKTVLVPEQNIKDVDEISDEIKKGLEIIFVSEMEKVIENAFVSA